MELLLTRTALVESMTDIGTIFAVSALAYVATNMDNFAILTTLLTRYPEQRFWVIAGHLAAVLATLLVAMAIGEAADYLPVQYLGYLGVIPVAMGLWWIYRLTRPVAGNTDEAATPYGIVFTATFIVMLSNSADTLLTQAVVFADTAARLDWAVCGSVTVVAAMLAGASNYSVQNPRLAALVQRYAARVSPAIMIAIGLYVLANTATDVVP